MAAEAVPRRCFGTGRATCPPRRRTCHVLRNCSGPSSCWVSPRARVRLAPDGHRPARATGLARERPPISPHPWMLPEEAPTAPGSGHGPPSEPPNVRITSPQPSALLIPTLPQHTTVHWASEDPDGPGPGPKKYFFKILQRGRHGVPAHRRDHPAGFAEAVLLRPTTRAGRRSAGRRRRSRCPISPNTRYLFVRVQVVDRRGNEDVVWSLYDNMLMFQVAFASLRTGRKARRRTRPPTSATHATDPAGLERPERPERGTPSLASPRLARSSLEQRALQHQARHREVDDDAGDVHQRGHERGRGAGGVEPGALQEERQHRARERAEHDHARDTDRRR